MLSWKQLHLKKVNNRLGFYRAIKKTIICATGANERSVYADDSEGPLVYRNVVIGVASFIISTDVIVSRSQAFTYVLPYLPQIYDKIIHTKH